MTAKNNQRRELALRLVDLRNKITFGGALPALDCGPIVETLYALLSIELERLAGSFSYRIGPLKDFEEHCDCLRLTVFSDHTDDCQFGKLLRSAQESVVESDEFLAAVERTRAVLVEAECILSEANIHRVVHAARES